jgi:putative ABC transport system substrate-binding protein
VTNLARPSGNVTGFTNFEVSMGGKWLELLKEVSPRITRVALIFNPHTAPFAGMLRSIEASAASLAIDITTRGVSDATELEPAIVAAAREPGTALIVFPDIFTGAHHEQIVALAEQYMLPAIYPFRFFAAGGGLMSYGIDTPDLFRRMAGYVDRIVKGAKPSDLPVQAPNKFELVINLKTAKALGLEIPPKLLALADEVIE